MKVAYVPGVLDSLEDAPADIRKAFFKQVRMLEQNLRYPSLQAKKFDESQDLWQARVTKDWRFYFVIRNDTYVIVRVIPHPK
jgi:mRNA-degrading endonuclease RelE of RelBE toxin-antitoxin system